MWRVAGDLSWRVFKGPAAVVADPHHQYKKPLPFGLPSWSRCVSFKDSNLGLPSTQVRIPHGERCEVTTDEWIV